MAHVDRKPKAGGTSRYTNEVAIGFDLIRETEVDRDFDDLYGEFNGGIDDTNIRAGASIDYSKLDLHGRIVPGDLVPGFTIPGGTVYPPGSIPGGAIAPGSITIIQLAPGASLFVSTTPSRTDTVNVTETETVFLEAVWTSRNGPIQYSANALLEAFAETTAAGAGTTLTFRIRQDGDAGVANGTVIDQRDANPIMGPSGVIFPAVLPFTLVAARWLPPLGAIGHRLKLTLQSGSAADTATIRHKASSLSVAEVA